MAFQAHATAAPARFWFSLSDSDPFLLAQDASPSTGPGAPTLNLVRGQVETVYLWGRPQTQNVATAYDATLNPFLQLQNLSFNLSLEPDDPASPAVGVTDFEFRNPGSGSDTRFERIIDSAPGNQVTINPGFPGARTFPEFTADGVERVAGFSLTEPTPHTGIGPSCLAGTGCVTGAEPSWLLGEATIDSLAVGRSELHLQIGSLSISHVDEETPSTQVQFGADTVFYDAAANRDVTLATDTLPEVVFDVVEPVPGDYNRDGLVNAADYAVWRHTLGSTTDLLADGDGDGKIDGPVDKDLNGVPDEPDDYTIWVANFGVTPGVSVAVPEPGAWLLLATPLVVIATRKRRGPALRRPARGVLLAAALTTCCAAQAADFEANWLSQNGSGLWLDNGNWDLGVVPENGANTFNATLGGFNSYQVLLNSPITIDGLRLINPQAELVIANAELNLDMVIAPIDGAIRLGGAASSFTSLSDDSFLNRGVLIGDAQSQASIVIGGLDNTGVLEASSGTLTVQTTFGTLNTGVFRVRNNARLELTSGVPYQHDGSAVLEGTGALANDSNGDGQFNALDSFENNATIRPGDPLGVLTIEGAFTQTPLGRLEIEVEGLTPGTLHDQLNVTGSASLAGRLDLPHLGGFTPMAGDEIVILTAAAATGRFDHVRTTGLSSNIAQRLAYTGNDVRVQYVPVVMTDFVATGPTALWSGQASVWSGAEPDSTTAVTIANSSPGGTPQQVLVTQPGPFEATNAAHRVTIGGPGGEVALVIDDASLSVSTTTAITSGGSVELNSGGLLATETLLIRQGGQFLGGGGVLIGDTAVGGSGSGAATFAPGNGLTLDGDYTQAPNGRYAVDIFDPNTDDTHGRASVSGQIALAGEVQIDVSGLTNNEFVPGAEYEILAFDGQRVGEFDQVEVVGRDDLYFDIRYTDAAAASRFARSGTGGGATVLAAGFLKGDGNQDGVIDGIDADIFASMLLDNSLLFFSYDCGMASPCTAFANFFDAFDFVDTEPSSLRVVDFFDIPRFTEALALSSGVSLATARATLADSLVRAEQRLAIPEASSLSLALLAMAGAAQGRRR